MIKASGLGKRYRLGETLSYKSLRESLAKTLRSPFRSSQEGGQQDRETLWALRDVTFRVERGEVLGIIGRNGAGKSTLLKILSRVTAPTEGEVRIRGRVGSLLEVGTGFHPELTGRENIYLNGTILGMTRREVRKKFDDIVEFAETEKFLDTPVKRYSSGMYVRLAFAVAAHLEPEVLLVDEVLAVGDIMFQQKCLGKMRDVRREGRTLLLEDGGVAEMSDDVQSVVSRYGRRVFDDSCPAEWRNAKEPAFHNEYFTPMEMFFSDGHGVRASMPVRNDEEVWLNIVGEVRVLDPSLIVSYGVYTEEGTYLFGSAFTDLARGRWPEIRVGVTRLRTRVPRHFFNEGRYRIELYGGRLHKDGWFAHPDSAEKPAVYLEIKGGLSESPYWTTKRKGLLAPLLDWESV
jgi:lipopolysaccharide transport system ATP-binding protein